MRAYWCWLAVLSGCLSGLVAHAQDRPIVAVFDIEDTRAKEERLSPEQLRSLTDYLSNKLAIGGQYKIVPRASVYAALQAKKSESYKACYDEACQIEIGKEVAAGKSLATKIDRLGAECIVTSTLFDLRQSATENSASYRGPCGQSELLTAVEQIAGRLRGETGGGAAKAGIRFDTSDLPAVPTLELPEDGGAAASGVDFGDVDVDAMELYDAAVQGEKDESVAIPQKIARWQQVQEKAPKFRAHATGRIVAWQEHARKQQQVEAVQKKRAARMMKDWEKLTRLRKLKVISEADRGAWTDAFYQAYEVEARQNPFARDPAVVAFLSALRGERLERSWEEVSRLATDRAIPHATRAAAVRRFLEDFPGDHARGAEARDHLARLERGREVKLFAHELDWILSRPAGVEFTRSEITVAQYRACAEAGRCSAPATSKYPLRAFCNWDMGRSLDQHPVNCVNWDQAVAFCEWAGGRLPTKEEWVAEASAGGTRAYPWGDEEPDCARAIWRRGGRACGRGSTGPVCSKPAGHSVSGLCDMSGNVEEWTSSTYETSNKGITWRVVCGGEWKVDYPLRMRASCNLGEPLSHDENDSGFRCVRPPL